MKIRIKGNSLRFRLSKSEVEKVVSIGFVAETTPFVNSAITYEVRVMTSGNEISAAYQNNTISMFVPEKMIQNWHINDVVTFEANMSISGGETLRLLLEKDFKCIDGNGEDQSDYFDNPNENC